MHKPALPANSPKVAVVTTTTILADVVRNVGGERVDVVSLVPDGADPHSYEPTLRDARNVVYAEAAFSNYAMLEEASVIKTLDANIRPGVPNVALAEESIKYAAEIIPLVENVNLDTIWLGLRASGTGRERGANRTSEVRLSAVAATGPGDIYGYLTGTFGSTEVYFNSADGFDAATGYKADTATLPAGAHTHLSWAFSKPGIYTLTLAASLQVDQTSKPVQLGQATYTFAVGVDPAGAGMPDAILLNEGHADLAVDVDAGGLGIVYDPSGGGEHSQAPLDPNQAVIVVPPKALAEIPTGGQFRFLGKPGTDVYQLPQAVLGKHVHGEIDPHLWHNPHNVMAYSQLIRDTLIGVDPAGAAYYTKNTAAYLAELEQVDEYVRQELAAIPPARRQLITTHDAFGYLAHRYGLDVAGFVTPNPAVEESLAQRRKLSETIRTLHVPAVFLEPNLAARASTLTEVAAEQGIKVCPLYGDTLDAQVTSYTELMRFNARSLRGCLAQH
ncbi:MAG: anchored repeat ABC transporter, substrate-binding protein [Buchananella hordeovulneris]|nr:anchored repeat ABC transporter, substrate-binding protein [Buchananella hordeovulneris]